MNKTYLILLLAFGIISCSKPESYTHTLDKENSTDFTDIIYISKAGETIKITPDSGSVQSPRMTDSVELVFQLDEVDYFFKYIDPKYFNLDGSITITKGVYHDFFPKEWESLRGSKDYVTYRFYSDEQHQFFRVINTQSGAEIGSYFYYE